jgi:hypothetical protein
VLNALFRAEFGQRNLMVIWTICCRGCYRSKDSKKEPTVKNTSRIVVSVISSSILTVATLALPARTANPTLRQNESPNATQVQAVSGKIASVGRNSFTLEIGSSERVPQEQQFQQSAQASTMMFQIDKNTTITGKLAVGSNADVTYRTNANGNNVAVSVSVTP